MQVKKQAQFLNFLLKKIEFKFVLFLSVQTLYSENSPNFTCYITLRVHKVNGPCTVPPLRSWPCQWMLCALTQSPIVPRYSALSVKKPETVLKVIDKFQWKFWH